MGLPDGWMNYDRVGKQVHGTRFIAFKVPLREGVNRGSCVPDEKQLYPKLLVSLVPNLGLIIDLTNTTKYYSPDEFVQLGVEYEKIQVQGHQVPNYDCSVKFRNRVQKFLDDNQDNDKLIGVHCTHGLNRSGFLICRYMIEELKIPASDAITEFEVARGHKMERENYIEKLYRLTGNKIPKLSSLAVDTETEKGTQTNRGYWISESSIPNRSGHTNSEALNDIHKQICVNVQRSNLIPDGRGNYFVHINAKDVQRKDTVPPNRHRSNFNKRSTHQNNLHQQRYQSHPDPAYMPRPIHNYGEQLFRMQTMAAPRYNDSLPNGNNNLAEDLLRMNNRRPSSRSRSRKPY